MEQKKLYTELHDNLMMLDMQIADEFAFDCHHNLSPIDIFLLSKKDMIDQYFYYLNQIILRKEKEITALKDYMKRTDVRAYDEWLVYNEDTEEWE